MIKKKASLWESLALRTKFLLARAGFVGDFGHPAIHKALQGAAQNGHVDLAGLLLEKGGADIHADDDFALHLAAARGHIEVVALLLGKGANLHADNNLALRWAAKNGHVDVVALLLENGADLHARNDDALQWAAKNGHADVVRILIAHLEKLEKAEPKTPLDGARNLTC